MWEGWSSQHVTSEPHIVRPWGTQHQTSWEFRVSLPAPVPIPTPCSQALQDASILPHWPPHSTALKGLCVKPRACWTKSEIALSTSQHGESNKVRAISSWILFWLSFLLFPGLECFRLEISAAAKLLFSNSVLGQVNRGPGGGIRHTCLGLSKYGNTRQTH